MTHYSLMILTPINNKTIQWQQKHSSQLLSRDTILNNNATTTINTANSKISITQGHCRLSNTPKTLCSKSGIMTGLTNFNQVKRKVWTMISLIVLFNRKKCMIKERVELIRLKWCIVENRLYKLNKV